jgi:hypothetical protein
LQQIPVFEIAPAAIKLQFPSRQIPPHPANIAYVNSVQGEERKGHHRHGKRHQLTEAGEASGCAVREDVDYRTTRSQ